MSVEVQTLVRVRCGNALIRAGIEATLRRMPEFDVRIDGGGAVLSNVHDLVADSRRQVLVADYENGIEAARALLRQQPHSINVLVVTWRESEAEIRHALNSGVRGYLLARCGVDEFVGGVRAAARGLRPLCGLAAQRVAESMLHPELTGREQEVLNLLARGFPNKAISARLGITVGTVKTHVRSLFEKLPATSRTEAAAVAEGRGLLRELSARDVSNGSASPPPAEPVWSAARPSRAELLREAA